MKKNNRGIDFDFDGKGALAFLEDNYVVSFEVCDKNKNVKIRELAESYCDTTLNKKEFGQLIKELQEIHNLMIDEV